MRLPEVVLNNPHHGSIFEDLDFLGFGPPDWRFVKLDGRLFRGSPYVLGDRLLGRNDQALRVCGRGGRFG